MLKAVSLTASNYNGMTAAATDAMAEFDALVSTVRPKFVNSAEAQLRHACCVSCAGLCGKNSCRRMRLARFCQSHSLTRGRNGVEHASGIPARPADVLRCCQPPLSELARLYQGAQESSEVDEAIAQCRLVIVEKSQGVWWDHHEHLIELSLAEFRTLLLLAKGASGQRVVSENEVYSDSASRSRWPTMIGPTEESPSRSGWPTQLSKGKSRARIVWTCPVSRSTLPGGKL